MVSAKEICLENSARLWVWKDRLVLPDFVTWNVRNISYAGMEGLIQEEVNLFKIFINQRINEPFDFLNKLNLPILNALWKVTVGERFEYDNPRLLSIVERLTEAFEIFGNPSQALLLAYPWLVHIIPSFFEAENNSV